MRLTNENELTESIGLPGCLPPIQFSVICVCTQCVIVRLSIAENDAKCAICTLHYNVKWICTILWRSIKLRLDKENV